MYDISLDMKDTARSFVFYQSFVFARLSSLVQNTVTLLNNSIKCSLIDQNTHVRQCFNFVKLRIFVQYSSGS